MPERARVFETIQIGKESAHGVAVAATKRLGSIGLTAAPRLTSSAFRPSGRKLNTIVIPGRRDSQAGVEGRLTFTEILYPLASLLGDVAPTTPAGATLAREWDYGMNAGGPDAYASYTIEGGSSVRASRFPHAVFTDLSMSFGTEEITLGGAVIGQKWEEPVTMTPAPTDLALIPVDPNDVSIYVDDDYASIGTTLMERCFAAEWGLTGKYQPVWAINAANGSWATVAEGTPEASMGMTFAADAAGMAFLDVFEEGATRYVRVEAVGPEIEAGQPYLFRCDFAAKVQEIAFNDVDAVVGAAWSFLPVDDPEIVGVRVKVRNKLTAL